MLLYGKIVEESTKKTKEGTAMSTLLHIEVSPMGAQSVSRAISEEYVQVWAVANPGGAVITRDLNANPVPHLDAETIFAGYTPEGEQPPTMAAKHAERQLLIDEILSVDEILISTPMWNWSLPSVLKAYFDQLVVPGQLDASDAQGLAGKKVTFVVAQGGSYAPGTPREGWDFMTGYLRHFATVLGSTDVEIILSELSFAGVVPGMDELIPKKEESIALAKKAANQRAAASLINA